MIILSPHRSASLTDRIPASCLLLRYTCPGSAKVYLQVPVRGGIQVVGVTNVIVLDIVSPNWMLI